MYIGMHFDNGRFFYAADFAGKIYDTRSVNGCVLFLVACHLPPDELKRAAWSTSNVFCVGSDCHSRASSAYYHRDMATPGYWTVWKLTDSFCGQPELSIFAVWASRASLSPLRYTCAGGHDDDSADDEPGPRTPDLIQNFSLSQRTATEIWSNTEHYVCLNDRRRGKIIVGLVHHPASTLKVFDWLPDRRALQIFEQGLLSLPDISFTVLFHPFEKHLMQLERMGRYQTVVDNCTRHGRSEARRNFRVHKYRPSVQFRNVSNPRYSARCAELDTIGDTDTSVTSEDDYDLAWQHD